MHVILSPGGGGGVRRFNLRRYIITVDVVLFIGMFSKQ